VTDISAADRIGHAAVDEVEVRHGDGTWPSRRQAYYAAWVLAVVWMCAQLNNGVMTLLVEPIKRDLHLTDMQMGYLLGFSQVLFYLVIGIPVARLVDRRNRKWLLTGSVAVWSVATGLCGLAQNFWQFFWARFGIGAGESINLPLSYSLLADYFPPSQLPRGIAVLNIGFTAGTAISLLLGALMIHILTGLPTLEVPLLGVMRDWQLVLILNGLVGLPVALLAASIIEPKRQGLSADSMYRGKARGATLREVCAYLMKHWRVYGPMFLGIALTSLHMFGLAGWMAAFYGRTYGWAPAKSGLYSGLLNLAIALPALGGSILINDRFRKRGHADTNMRVLVLCFTTAAPFMILMPLMPWPWLALAMSGVASAVMLVAAPSMNAALQVVTPNQMRGQVTALYVLTMTAIGMGMGPTFFAFLTEYVWGGEMLLRYSVVTSAIVLFPAAALVYWSGLKPYRARMLEMQAAGARV
jgi:MFS family permease